MFIHYYIFICGKLSIFYWKRYNTDGILFEDMLVKLIEQISQNKTPSKRQIIDWWTAKKFDGL